MNKTDRLPQARARDILAEIGEGAAISALEKVGLLNLLRQIAQHLPEPLERIRLVVPNTGARALAEIFAQGRIISQEYGENGITIDAELPRVHAQRLRALYDGTGSV